MFAAVLASALLLGPLPDGRSSEPSHDRQGVVDLKLPDKIRPIVEMVNAAPPEFGAAALERLLESGRIEDVPTRRELTERAFQLAALAHDPWRPRAVPGAGFLASAQARAGDLQLDRLSLQVSAVRLMVPLDKRRARDMFLEIPKPEPQALTCDDWLGGDFGDFYRTLALVVEETFTPAERRREDDIHLVIDYLGAIASPFQLQPALRMIIALNVKADQKHVLLVQLGAAMGAVQADDRSFSLVSAGLSVELPPELQTSFQRFVGSHSTAVHCDARVKSVEEQSAEEKKIANDEMNLLFTGGTLVSKAERATPKWEQRMDDFLNGLANWRQGDNEAGPDYYHRRMTVYQSLLDVTSGALRARLIDDMVHFALDSNLLRDAPAEWFFELKTADDHVRGSSAKGPDVLVGFERSGHPVLLLAAALERGLAAR
jgi:hypothetical protein